MLEALSYATILRMPNETVDECSDLLRNNDNQAAVRKAEPVHDRRHSTFSRVVIACMILYFLVEMYDMMTIAPLTALFEQAACQKYYKLHEPALIKPGGSVGEKYCKLNPIQAELAILRGWKSTFDAIPGEQCRCKG